MRVKVKTFHNHMDVIDSEINDFSKKENIRIVNVEHLGDITPMGHCVVLVTYEEIDPNEKKLLKG